MPREIKFFNTVKGKWIFLAEFILLLAGVLGLLAKPQVVWRMEDPRSLNQERIALSPGIYTLRFDYYAEGSDTGYFHVMLDQPTHRSLLSNPIPFVEGLSQGNCQFYLKDPVEDLVVVSQAGEGVEILGAEIISGRETAGVCLFWILLFLLLLNCVLLLFWYHKKYGISKEKWAAILSIPVFALTASLPVMTDYISGGADLGYHILRIEALADAIRQGHLSVRIGSMWLSGHGYASAVFYGETWLFLPALLRILGFSMDFAYRFFLVAVNLTTAWVAYLSFSKCFKKVPVGILASALYTLAPYRMYNVYNRAAVGEFTAMIFLPLLIWGFYRIYTEPVEKKGYLWNWVIPVIGFSGIIQSHVLSCEMVGFFVILLCLLLWKRTFRKRTFAVLCSIVGMTLLVNAWFLIPFLDLMSADQYYFGVNAGNLIQKRGIYPAQIFYTLQASGNSPYFVENGMKGVEPINPGAALLAGLFLWLFLRSRKKGSLTPEEKKLKKAGDIGFGFTVLALFMSTCCFPWDYLSTHSRVLAALIGSLQFPTRITAMVTIFGVFTACAAGRWLVNEGKISFLSANNVLVLIIVTALVFTNYQVDSILAERNGMLRLYSMEHIGTTQVIGAEYLPIDADINHMTYHAPVLGNGVTMENYGKDGLEVTADVYADEASYVEFPLLYYKGYEAESLDAGGQKLALEKGDNCDVRLLLPEGYQGRVRVRYAGMWYWHVAEAVSVTVGIGAFILFFAGKRRRSY